MVDSQLCETYGWTWAQLQATPHYIRVMFANIQTMKAAARAQEEAKARGGRGA